MSSAAGRFGYSLRTPYAAAKWALVGLAKSLASEIVVVNGDCYGDAVNTASRLSDLSGARQIWASDSVTEQVDYPAPGVRFHALGNITIRGKAQQLLGMALGGHAGMVAKCTTYV